MMLLSAAGGEGFPGERQQSTHVVWLVNDADCMQNMGCHSYMRIIALHTTNAWRQKNFLKQKRTGKNCSVTCMRMKVKPRTATKTIGNDALFFSRSSPKNNPLHSGVTVAIHPPLKIYF